MQICSDLAKAEAKLVVAAGIAELNHRPFGIYGYRMRHYNNHYTNTLMLAIRNDCNSL
ncbi:hypothetical protein Lal_00043888 [Lupinus albus]|nr:hypothetical protein Lal_00043888 [Lupinus albus]